MIDVTRADQARALLTGKGPGLAARLLGRRPVSAADYAAAFTVEWIDLIAEIPDEAALLGLGLVAPGARDGVCVVPGGGVYRVFYRERGVDHAVEEHTSFDAARAAFVDLTLRRSGVPFVPPGR